MDFNQIYNEDCVTGMQKLPDNCIDLCVTSPPYNLGVKYDVYNDWMEWDVYYDWCRLWSKEIYRVLKPDGRFCINHYISCGTAEHRSAPLMNINAICEFEIGFKHHGFALWTESSTVKRTAWGSFLSASAPYISSPHEGIDILYKDHWKKDRKGISTIERKEFFEGTLGIWKMQPVSKTKRKTMAQFPLELPMRCIKLLSYKNDIVLDPFMGCFDEQTEVLTENGWKLFKDVNPEEKICSLNPNTDEIEFVRFEKKIDYSYNGEMYHILGRSVDLLVTPNHKLYAKEYHHKKFSLISADKMDWVTFHKKNNGMWISEDNADQTWLEFLGFWYGDGYINKTKRGFRIGFNLQKQRKKIYLEDILAKLGMKYCKYEETDRTKYHINDVSLKNFFSGDTHTKKIPDYIFKLSKDCITSFIKGFTLADGDRRGILYSCNKTMIDQLQVLLLLSGRSGIIITRVRETHSTKSGKRIKGGSPQYALTLHNQNKELKLKKTNISKKSYNGQVYDVTLEKNHILYVRRNGKPCWSGNSGTTAYAAKMLDRQYIGFEISENYWKESMKCVAQCRLDTGENNNV